MVKFFHDHPLNKQNRFNMLLLDHGEHFIQDRRVSFSPLSVQQDLELQQAQSFNRSNCITGKLKICSRSIVFEPQDSFSPIIKFPFDNIKKNHQIQPIEINDDNESKNEWNRQCTRM